MRAVTTVLAAMLLSACASGPARPSSPPPVASSTAPTLVPTPGSAPSTGPPSGIVGTATIDGGCPVARADPPCPDRPLRARLVVTGEGSEVAVASTESDADGHFTIALPPGRYQVRPASLTGAALPRADPVTVVVEPGRYATITVRFDSGIRRPG